MEMKYLFIFVRYMVTKITKREKDVLSCIAKGLKGKKIADELLISYETVRTHRKNLLLKFEASSSVELIKKAIKEGVI